MKLTLLLSVLSLTSLSAEVNTAAEMFARALKDGDVHTIETLLSSGLNPNQPLRGGTPLFFAIQYDRALAVQLLLAAHADPDARMTAGSTETPLQYATQAGNLPLARILIKGGAHLDAKGTTGRTAVHFAVAGHRLDMLHLLLDKGADPNLRDAEGASPLDDAAWHGDLDAVAILLAHSARLNDPDTQTGATPINEAAFTGRAPLVQYLLQFHPDLAIPDHRGYTPLDNAIRMGKEPSAQLLLDAAPTDGLTPQILAHALEAATPKDESLVVAALLQHGAQANGLMPSGSTPLDLAAFTGASNVVRVLLEHGADPNLPGGNGTTPLEDAALKGFDRIAGMLLDHGARVNRALYSAADFGRVAVVKLLLDRGANPNVCGPNRKTPYRAAVNNGFGELATLIHDRGGSETCEP